MTRGSAPMELDVALAKKCQRAPVIAWFLISSASFSIYFCITVENPTRPTLDSCAMPSTKTSAKRPRRGIFCVENHTWWSMPRWVAPYIVSSAASKGLLAASGSTGSQITQGAPDACRRRGR